MNRSFQTVLTIILGLLVVSCDLPWEPGPQPTSLIDTGSETRIVVFGVFRPDTGMSFIEVSGSFNLDEATEGQEIPWPEPDVVVVDSLTGEIFDFAPDSSDSAYFYLEDFAAQVGHTYQVTVTAPDYEPLTGSTTVPVSPSIEQYLLSDRNLTITLNTHPNIHSYEIHLTVSDGTREIKTITSNGDAMLSVDFTWSDSMIEATKFVVYGYERNLGEYLSTTISVKPQSYQPQTYYVEGGFGVIGALNFTEPIMLGN